jgi:hypothetical protein
LLSHQPKASILALQPAQAVLLVLHTLAAKVREVGSALWSIYEPLAMLQLKMSCHSNWMGTIIYRSLDLNSTRDVVRATWASGGKDTKDLPGPRSSYAAMERHFKPY